MHHRTDVVLGDKKAIRLTIAEKRGRIRVIIDADKYQLNQVDIEVLNSGVPGIIGPDVSFNVGAAIQEINDRACEDASIAVKTGKIYCLPKSKK